MNLLPLEARPLCPGCEDEPSDPTIEGGFCSNACRAAAEPPDPEPLCRTRGCADLGIPAMRGDLCMDCFDAAQEDAADATRDAAREARRLGIKEGEP